MTFDYEGARKEGYSDQEILEHLSEKHKNFDFQGARKEGYSVPEIINHLSSKKPEKKEMSKAGRLATQAGIGLAESALLPYELAQQAVQFLPESEEFKEQKQQIYGELDSLLDKKETGDFTEQDQKRFEELQGIASKINDKPDLSVAGMVEKFTGIDTHPEGFAEKSVRWTSFLKNPSKGFQVLKNFVQNPRQFLKPLKELIPGTKTLRGVTAGTALQLAEDNELGPIGTMAAAVVGDVIGGGIGGGLKVGGEFAKGLVTEPKQTLANLAAKFSKTDQQALQKAVIEDFRKSGIQADLGSIIDSNIIKWTQARLAQSGLTGEAFEKYKETLTNQIKTEYEALAKELGQDAFMSEFEAGEAVKNTVKNIREAELEITRNFYKEATESLKDRAFVNPKRISQLVERLEKELKPGRLKSGEQQAVLNVLEKLKTDITDSSGSLIYANVKDLMNNKIALNDIINYEVQGGAKQLLKGLVYELDRAIVSHGKDNPGFASKYIKANKKFSEHAKTFRNKNIDQVLRSNDPAQLMKKMDSIQGIRDLQKVMSKTPEGRNLFNKLKRTKLENAIGKNMIDGMNNQVKMGTFSNLLKKGNNREIFKEILSKPAFERLERLQQNAGKLADAANKFYNASKSGSVAVDAAILARGIGAVAQAIGGNPWPLLKIGGGIYGGRSLSQLLTDPEFLKLAEEAVINYKNNNIQKTFNVFEEMRPYIMPFMQQDKEEK